MYRQKGWPTVSMMLVNNALMRYGEKLTAFVWRRSSTIRRLFVNVV
jgi:hypothetical protein